MRTRKRAGERGATVAEYAVILAVFALIVMGSIVIISDRVGDSFDGVIDELATP